MDQNRLRLREQHRGYDRQIFALALPALGALIAEPIFLATDTAMVGHLGPDALAGLAIAGSLLQTMIGLMIFLAYATTPLVARRWGAGDLAGAYSTGLASVFLAALLGVILVIIGLLLGPLMIAAMNPTPTVAEAAGSYFYIAMIGVPPMLMVLALTGLLRGLHDTRTPLYVSVIGFGLNILLNFILIYGLDFGIVGSAAGLALVQWLMFFALAAVVWMRVKSSKISLRLKIGEVITNLKIGFWLFLRTITLRLALLASVVVGTAMGTTSLAAYQIIFTLFSIAAFALDALAISAQAMVGKSLGEQNPEQTRAIINRTIRWGIISGIFLTIIWLLLTPVLGYLFTTDAAVLELLPWALVILAISMPLSGYVFVLDGVLMGAADVKYLAWAGVINSVVYLPLLAIIYLNGWTGTFGLVILTIAYCFGFMGIRALTLGLRVPSLTAVPSS